MSYSERKIARKLVQRSVAMALQIHIYMRAQTQRVFVQFVHYSLQNAQTANSCQHVACLSLCRVSLFSRFQWYIFTGYKQWLKGDNVQLTVLSHLDLVVCLFKSVLLLQPSFFQTSREALVNITKLQQIDAVLSKFRRF